MEYSKIVAVLIRNFGLEHIEVAEDIASDTFLAAVEVWSLKGAPENPVAWLYTVAKNKVRNHVKRDKLFTHKISKDLAKESSQVDTRDPDLTTGNILDSQLQMMFAVCHPEISREGQVGLALRLLCGFSIDEIATAFVTNRETINKRLFRAKQKLRSVCTTLEFPPPDQISTRLESVLRTLYLLFNEGYYSLSQAEVLKEDLCKESMRLTILLSENLKIEYTPVEALIALMCFQASRMAARKDNGGKAILFEQQNRSLWDSSLINLGKHYMVAASQGNCPGKYHFEAAIAFWHTQPVDHRDKWRNILMLYNQLLQVEYSPLAALNRSFVISKLYGKAAAIEDATRLKLEGHLLYHSLLGELYEGIDAIKAINELKRACALSPGDAERKLIAERILKLEMRIVQ